MEIAAALPGAEVTAALAGELPRLDPRRMAALLEALARRGDRAARGAAEALLESSEPPVRLEAVRALGRQGDASSVERLAVLAASGGEAGDAARESLSLLSAPGVDAAVISRLASGEPALRAVLIRAAAERGCAEVFRAGFVARAQRLAPPGSPARASRPTRRTRCRGPRAGDGRRRAAVLRIRRQRRRDAEFAGRSRPHERSGRAA